MGEVTKPDRHGARNPFWKGGRSVASHGYVLIRVGADHHLADVRGYAYEHRLVAEKKIGRKLRPGEQVHHLDHNKQNNNPANLEVEKSLAHHRAEHRKLGRNLRNPGEPNPLVFCACGCGKSFSRFDAAGRHRRFVSGHNPPRSKLNADQVAEIRLRLERGDRRVDIAAAFGISKSQLYNISSGRHWGGHGR